MTVLHLLAAIQYPHLDPEAFHIWKIHVRWYGLAYVAGLMIGYFLLSRMIKQGRLRIKLDHLADLILWLAVGVMVGGRLGWWFFYHRNFGTPEPWYEPIAAWHGGMSFHGAVICVALAAFLWAWFYRAPFGNVVDCMALVAPIGLFLGRLANFVNHELVGRPSNVPWAVIFPGDDFGRHPSQIYEAILEGPVLMAVLWGFYKFTRLWDGAIASLFLVFYGLFRFSVEFTREPDPQLGFIAWGWLTMGQLLSVALVVLGLVMLWISRSIGRKRAPLAAGK